MSKLYSVSEVRTAERRSIASGVAEYTLMQRAGFQAADIINQHYPEAVRFVVLCGGGNNGGDALVAAGRLFERYQREVVIYSVKELADFTGCAAFAACDLPRKISFRCCKSLIETDFFPGDVIIDGLLGIGFAGGALRPEVKSFITAANASGCPVAALDLPSGLNGDTGEISSDGAVNADLTVTFGMLKAGLFAGEGSRLRGKIRLVDIGIEADADPRCEVFSNTDAFKSAVLPDFACHKNSRGRVLIWGGSEKYPGAPVLCARGALHSGAGIVRLISTGDCSSLAPAELIVKKIQNGSDLKSEVVPFFPQSDILVAGCGWGDDIPVEALDIVQEFPGTVILDADALNMLSRNIAQWQFRDQVIITPHPGEAARLAAALDLSEYTGDRKQLALKLASVLKCVVLLKGRDSVVAGPDGNSCLISSGNYACAAAGSGDVLAGILAAVAAGKKDLFAAAAFGAYLHGAAGETFSGIPTAGDLPEQAGDILTAMRQKRWF